MTSFSPSECCDVSCWERLARQRDLGDSSLPRYHCLACAIDNWAKQEKKGKEAAAAELKRSFDEAVREAVAQHERRSESQDEDEFYEEADVDEDMDDEDEEDDDDDAEDTEEEFLADLMELGLGEGADWEDVQRAYRELSKSLHPDILASKDLPPKLLAIAKEKFMGITEAYHRLRLDFASEDDED